MKKQVITGIILFLLFFLMGGAYLITTVDKSTTSLSQLIKLHQVELLRENLLNQIRKVQNDLNLKDTRYARDFDTVIGDVQSLQTTIDRCPNCHHRKHVELKLEGIRDDVETYKEHLSRVLTISANTDRLQREMDNAFHFGERLNGEVNHMVHMANINLAAKTKTALTNINRSKVTIFMLIGVGSLLSLLISYLFVKNFTFSVDTLLDATRKLKKGNLDHRIEGLKDEFAEVAASFNEMSDSLKQQMVKMQRTEQMVLFGEYAARLAHEIKSPLAGIKVAIEVLPGKLSLKQEEKDLLEKITAEIERIGSLLDSLMEYAKPSNPHLMPVEISNIVSSAISFAHKGHGNMQEKLGEVTIVREIDKDLPPIMADPMQLQQILLNLVNNSFDAMEGGGTLTIRARQNNPNNSVEITLIDTGNGMDKVLMEKIFQPFFTTKPKGTGLGLPITNQLVEQNGGKLRVESEHGKGTTFFLTFPVWKDQEVQ